MITGQQHDLHFQGPLVTNGQETRPGWPIWNNKAANHHAFALFVLAFSLLIDKGILRVQS